MRGSECLKEEKKRNGVPPVNKSVQRSAPDTNRVAKLLTIWLAMMYAFQLLSKQLAGEDVLWQVFAKWNEAIARGEWWRLFTYAFVHGSLFHFLTNTIGVYALGTWMGRRVAGKSILVIFFLGIIGGGIASYFLTPPSMLGASPAFYALCTAWLVYLLRYGGKWEKIFWLIVVLIDIWLSFQPELDHWAHFGGMAAGLAAGLFLSTKGEK